MQVHHSPPLSVHILLLEHGVDHKLGFHKFSFHQEAEQCIAYYQATFLFVLFVIALNQL